MAVAEGLGSGGAILTDIAIVWDSVNARGDWTITNGGIATGPDIISAVLVSLFTDRRASDDFTPPDGTGDRRGWWADTYEDSLIGSRLWQLARAKKAGSTSLLREAEDYCREALQWLLDDGVAATISVATRWINGTTMGIRIMITEPSGAATTFDYAWAWNGIGDTGRTTPVRKTPAPLGVFAVDGNALACDFSATDFGSQFATGSS